MALHSTIVVTKPMPRQQIEDLFHHCRKAVADLPGTRSWGRRPDPKWRHGHSTNWRRGHCEFEAAPQGLPVHLRVVYSLHRPLTGDREDQLPAGSMVEIVVSSSGSASDPRNHATIIRTAVTWLDGRGLPSQWCYEDQPWRAGTRDLHHVPAA